MGAPLVGPLDVPRKIALYFTMTVAILAGITALAGAISSPAPAWLNTAGNVLIVLVMIAGVVMAFSTSRTWLRRAANTPE